MSELTTVARPYARAAFEFAVSNNNVAAWSEMLFFARSCTRCNSGKKY